MVLAEKGGQDDEENEVELLVAGKKFRILATMNPGGDFGKKEVNVKTSGNAACIFLVLLAIKWLEVQCQNVSCQFWHPVLSSWHVLHRSKEDWGESVLCHFRGLSLWHYK